MCGINGIVYKKGSPDIREVQNMNLAIKHRGPDDEGIYKFENTVLGHVRLSIIDLSSKGKQPMTNDGRYWIIFNGEIYNFKEIKKKLEIQGHKFYSNTDTEVILNAYKEWGHKCFENFNGMWSFCILDEKEKKLIISRDRYGVKPCYIFSNNDKIIFSSEIKGVYSSYADLELNENRLLLNYKTKERCFTTDFKKLEIIQPGYIYEVNIENYNISKTRWWNGLNNLPEINPSKKNIKEKIQNLLFESTKLRLVSDVKIASSLSGGIDSSIIFSILNQIKDNKVDLNPFIVKYASNKTFDSALQLSKYYNRNPVVVEYDERNLDKLSEKLSSIEITDLYFSQLEIYKAQNQLGYKVSIDGHGADEALGGYKKDIEHFGMFFQNSIADLYETITNLKGQEELNRTVQRLNLVPNLNKFNIDLSSFIKSEFSTNKYIDSEQFAETPESLIEDIKNLEEFNFPLQILYLNSSYGHLQWLLNKWDKASMSSSVEIRSPFLDWNFFQYALAIPAEMKIDQGLNKSILRKSFEDILPNYISDKTFKQGLPQVDFKVTKETLNLVHSIINQDDFKNNLIWDGKKINKEFNKKNFENNDLASIWKIVRIFLLVEGFNKRKKDIIINKQFVEESFNKLI